MTHFTQLSPTTFFCQNGFPCLSTHALHSPVPTHTLSVCPTNMFAIHPTERQRGRELRPRATGLAHLQIPAALLMHPRGSTFHGCGTNIGTLDCKLCASANRTNYFQGRDTSIPRDRLCHLPGWCPTFPSKQSTNIFDPRRLNEMPTFSGQLIDHPIVATTSEE